MPCFYQEGKSIEQSERDLLACAYSDHPVCLCMQDRGYRYLDAKQLPRNSKRKKTVLLFQDSVGSSEYEAMTKEYWVVDGRDMSPDSFKIVSESGAQATDPNTPSRQLIGYRFWQDDMGKFTKTPVYGSKNVIEPGTQTAEPNKPSRQLIGYRLRQDDLGKFTKTPVYGSKNVIEPETQTTEPNTQPGKLAGYKVRQDDFGNFIKIPVYEEE
jgi:hypothetical protein